MNNVVVWRMVSKRDIGGSESSQEVVAAVRIQVRGNESLS